MKKLSCAALSLLAMLAHAQNTPQNVFRADIAGGYSFFYIVKGFTVAMSGASGSIAFNVTDWLGLVGDLGVYHDLPGGPGLTGVTYTFGPRYSYRKLPDWCLSPRHFSVGRIFPLTPVASPAAGPSSLLGSGAVGTGRLGAAKNSPCAANSNTLAFALSVLPQMWLGYRRQLSTGSVEDSPVRFSVAIRSASIRLGRP